MTEVQLIYTATEIRDLEAERDSQRDRADSKQRGWDEANRQLDAMATERDSLKAKLAEAERELASIREVSDPDCEMPELSTRDQVMHHGERSALLTAMNRLIDRARAERDAAVQDLEAIKRRTVAVVQQDTERRVVEEIVVLLESMANEQGIVSGMQAAAAVRAGAYRKQGARDGE